MLISELKDGQKLEALDDLYFLDVCGEENVYDTEDCYIQLTGTHLKQLSKIASAGDIGTYNEEFSSIKFLQPKENDPNYEEEYIFFEGEDAKLDLDLFALVEGE